MYNKRAGIEFGIDSNVHVEIIGPDKNIRQSIDVHNKATDRLVSGILKFIKGEFNPTYRRTNINQISPEAKGYIPCYINIGTGGIKLTETDGVILPDYNPLDRRIAPLEDSWNVDTNYVRFNDTKLTKEQTAVSRYEISGTDNNADAIITTSSGDIAQIVLTTSVMPGTFTKIYSVADTDIFITEIGLFASSVPNTEDLLARVIFKNNGEDPEDTGAKILYLRPQDTLIVNWIISIISLNDYNEVDEDSTYTNIDSEQSTIPAGTVIDDNIPYSGTLDNEGD